MSDKIYFFDWLKARMAGYDELSSEREKLIRPVLEDVSNAYLNSFELESVKDRIMQQNREKYTVLKDFYCSECRDPQPGIPCKPEDGAIGGYCPTCNRQRTFIHGNPPQKKYS